MRAQANMPVEAVVRDVRLPADKPFEERLPVVVQNSCPRFEPVQLARLRGPEAFQVAARSLGQVFPAFHARTRDNVV
jgi:hypothetical protein